MQIDVIIPTYNRLWALRRVARFYLEQKDVRQVIIVDDGGSDGTWEWLNMEVERETRLVGLRHESNRGASAARNTGADVAQSPVVFFADDDMLFTPSDGLAKMLREMESQSADIAAPIHIVSESSFPAELPPVASSFSGRMPVLFQRWTLELHARKKLARCVLPKSFFTPLACGLMMMRREVLEKVRYDEGFGTTSYRDETDFQLKALRKGFRLLACACPVFIDLARIQDNGGCHTVTPVKYELRAWKNNWSMLVRHRDVIQQQLGIRMPILLLQSCFIAKHVVNRLARYYVGRSLRRYGFLRKRV